ncbi:MAG: UvrD-helicase domain-containing protein, partial [Dokdonella sp.]
LQRWQQDAATRKRDVQRLQLALAEIDVAPITTLHGLCLRILRDYPFESGSTFGLGEMISGDSVLNELADDLWRQLQQGPVTPPAFPSLSSLGKLRTRLGLCLRPGVGLWCPSAAEMAAVRDPHVADAIDTFAERKGIWALTETGRQSSTLKNALKALAKWIRDPETKLTATQLTHLHNRAALLDPGQCEDLLADPAMAGVGELLRYMGYDDNADEIKAWSTWTAELRALREKRLTAAGRLTFDDLITRVHDALCATSTSSLVQTGNGLADRLFAEWKVALIDEFQDTDAQQYGILDRIYREDDGRPRGRLVMIGDPKQAIYRFRGGDIDAYRLAADDVDTCLELDTNFRSSRGYVDAVNEWFARAGAGLSSQPKHPIAFHPVKASTRCDESPLQLGGAAVKKPLVLHYQPSGPDNADFPVAAATCRQLALVACANQIAAMLNDPQMRIGDARVAPKDIAVLLPTNPDIANLRHLLQARNVPCVGAGRSSVFQTDWALELQIVLYAVDNPADEAAVRAALATRLGGLDFAELCSLRDEVEAWQSHCARYFELRQKWRRSGVLAVVLELAGEAMQRMPRAEARERAMTDLRHLGELLQQQSELLHGASQLLAWLADQRAGDSSEAGEAADEQQLRIESDAKRVRLMTLHASKGLEFPIVFLPLMWAHGKFGHDSTPVINERLCGRRVIGFGHDPAAQYDEEGQDERFRVLYVALTRAVHACHVYALHPSRLSRKGAKEPLKDPARAALDAMIARLGEASPSFEHIDWVVADWPQVQVDYVPPANGRSPDPQSLREPSEAPFEFKWSFSTLTKSGVSGQREEEPADDEEPLDALLLEPAVAEVEQAVAAAATAGDEATTRAAHEELLALGFSRGAP